jgi:predicted ATP-dependent endonuclease of OLD family
VKLVSLQIKNFKRIGPDGCNIRIDQIVVLVGRNNVGKSTVLDAYEAFASMGSPLTLSHFHNENSINPIEITGVFGNVTVEDEEVLSAKWTHNDPEYGRCIKVKWIWTAPEKSGQKQSFNPETGTFEDNGVGGMNSLIQSRIPKPVRIKPTDSTETTQTKIVSMLKDHVKTKLKEDSSRAKGVIDQIEILAGELLQETKGALNELSEKITKNVAEVFPGATIELVPKSKDSIDEKIVGAESFLRIGTAKETAIPLMHQGTGLQRALLWSALAVMSNVGPAKKKTKGEDEATRILLIDEPEAFLHPPTVRGAREALYAFALNNPEWQVIATTHSPVFIDLSKSHTTIIRVDTEEKTERFISTDRISFDAPERTRLQMIRACNPVVNEFFFYDNIVLVEGPTEHLAVKHCANALGLDVHVIDCMGKANIPLFARILNQFKSKYIVIHDSDTPKIFRKENVVNSGTWTINNTIRDAAAECAAGQVFTQFPHFEGEFFGESLKGGKVDRVHEILGTPGCPEYESVMRSYSRVLNRDKDIFTSCAKSFDAKYKKYVTDNKLESDPLWAVPA